MQDIVLSQDKLARIEIVAVKELKDVLEHALDWSKQKTLKQKIVGKKQKV